MTHNLKKVILGTLALAILVGCGQEAPEETNPKKEKTGRIESIKVTKQGETTTYWFEYSSDKSVTINIADRKGNESVHEDFSKNGKIIEAISGEGRINHFYGPNDNRIGSFLTKENIGIQYEYDEKNRITKQVNTLGNDTLGMYIYGYSKGDSPSVVMAFSANGNMRKYALKYDGKPNVLRNKFEAVFPPEDLLWLGHQALYGKYNLIQARLIEQTNATLNSSTSIYDTPPSELSYVHTVKGSKRLIESTSEGTRRWIAELAYDL